jgi:hypothetical protein
MIRTSILLQSKDCIQYVIQYLVIYLRLQRLCLHLKVDFTYFIEIFFSFKIGNGRDKNIRGLATGPYGALV